MAFSQFGNSGGGTSSTIGATYPSVATAAGAKDLSGNLAALLTDTNGYLEVNVKTGGSTPSPPSASTLTLISASTSNQMALAGNANRLGAIFFNNSDTQCFIRYGTPASATNAATAILPGATWRMAVGEYSGQIDVIWISDTGAAAPTGALRVTESTP